MKEIIRTIILIIIFASIVGFIIWQTRQSDTNLSINHIIYWLS